MRISLFVAAARQAISLAISWACVHALGIDGIFLAAAISLAMSTLINYELLHRNGATK